MHYRSLASPLALIVLAGQPALAGDVSNLRTQRSMVDTSGLPQVRFHTAPRFLDVVPEGDIWHFPAAPSNSRADIDGMQVPLPATATGGGYAQASASRRAAPSQAMRTDNPMVPRLNDLPQAGFQPYFLQKNPPARPLASATRSDLLGRLKPSLPLHPGAPSSAGMRSVPAPAHAIAPRPAPAVLRYADQPCASLSAGSKASTSVRAVRLSPSETTKRLLSRQAGGAP